VKSDEKTSLARAPPVNGAPARSREIGKAGRPSSYPKTLLAANAKSHLKLQNVCKVRTVLCGGLEHQTPTKATVFAEHPPAQLTLLLTVLPSGNGLAESARSGKYAAPHPSTTGSVLGSLLGPVLAAHGLIHCFPMI
jgi:hypothetical protein